SRSADWRGLHGVGSLRSPRQQAAARAMWAKRDAIAAREDLSPHRVIRDREIVAAAKAAVRGRAAFDRGLPASLRKKAMWWKAARSGVALPASPLPPRPASAYPPPHELWSRGCPRACTRSQALRPAVSELFENLAAPTENLLQ